MTDSLEIFPLKNDLENPLKSEAVLLGDGPRGQDFYNTPDGEALHLANWLECIRTRKRPNAPAEAGASVAAAAHLGNLSFRNGRIANGRI